MVDEVPRFVVLVPYFEDAEGLLSTLRSLEESGRIPVLVVDDGSELRPASEAIDVDQFALDVRVMTLPTNRGIEHALNAGAMAIPRDVEFIVRIDCGDRAAPDRIGLQLAEFDRRPNLVALGTWATFTDRSGNVLYTVRSPVGPASNRRLLHVNSTLIHPTMMLRRAALERVGYYPLDAPAAEDFALLHLLRRVGDIDNLAAPLTTCIISETGISNVNRRRQLRSRLSVLARNFEFSHVALWGLARVALQYYTPRSVSVTGRRLVERFRKGAG